MSGRRFSRVLSSRVSATTLWSRVGEGTGSRVPVSPGSNLLEHGTGGTILPFIPSTIHPWDMVGDPTFKEEK